ncbi:MAG: hypothetical protein U5K74_05540, partial [Gemmatimonadaceae bacterium]|nr:hypothetical protein [Gemmatimonadaceae bacterium]
GMYFVQFVLLSQGDHLEGERHLPGSAMMNDAAERARRERYDLSTLRVCTFCAEPTSPTVQQFGMDLLAPWYINSYWATEHGGIVWTHFFGNGDFPFPRGCAHLAAAVDHRRCVGPT